MWTRAVAYGLPCGDGFHGHYAAAISNPCPNRLATILKAFYAAITISF